MAILGECYRDQTGGTQVALVWLDQVQFRRVTQSEFQKTVRTLLGQGYRKIGMISARSQYFVDPYEVKKLAADKGARLVVGCWFTARETRTNLRTVDYWYQLLDKATAPAPSAIPQTPAVVPVRSRCAGWLASARRIRAARCILIVWLSHGSIQHLSFRLSACLDDSFSGPFFRRLRSNAERLRACRRRAFFDSGD